MLDLLIKNSKTQLSRHEVYNILINQLDVQDNPPLSEQEFNNLLENYDSFDVSKIENLYNDGLITLKQKDLYIDTYNLMNSESSTLEQKYSQITVMENQILIDDTIMLAEKEPILAFMSVTKNSMTYWSQGENKAKWWQVVIADAVGGAVGFHFGCLFGGVILGAAASYEMAQA